MKYGVRPVVVAGSASTLSRLISRQRNEKCPDTEAVDSPNPVFSGKMINDNDGGEFMLFDSTCGYSNSCYVAFASHLALEVLESSQIVLSDGTFAVAQAPFKQIWCIYAQCGDSIVPVVHVLMESRSREDYEFVIEKIKNRIPSWNPTDYLGGR
ncbi:hypothetical protein GCK72_008467 [Caenorhabditis remanei]|uniref:MULE transposase domain-containing protein n=1 Tax=Caenorhabditis remanei TaxID=31234 RepID=A0A6A5GZT9_CAERE|nr:hypothetical protein GCK72_008467 [Caenorhabditis remanei]KAF1760221.1 hypothetical protein GCK72_008467 [Caenorhabditis remanei]